MFKIKTMNAIAPAGIEALERRGCTVGEDVDAPEGILLRSADLHEYPLNPELLAIARAITSHDYFTVKKKIALNFSFAIKDTATKLSYESRPYSSDGPCDGDVRTWI